MNQFQEQGLFPLLQRGAELALSLRGVDAAGRSHSPVVLGVAPEYLDVTGDRLLLRP